MKILKTCSGKHVAAVASFLFAAEALAGPGGVGSITYGPLGAEPIPALGGVGLMVLSALLAIVSLRFLKDRKRGGGHFLVLATVAGALATGGSGLKLVNDAFARPAGVVLEEDAGGTVEIPFEGFSEVINRTGTKQKLLNISTVPGCYLQEARPNGGNGGAVLNGGMNGGSYRGDCSDSPPTELDDGDYCEVLVCCSENGGNGGGCFPI